MYMMPINTPLKLSAVVAACNAVPAPVVFIDTCALLDLIRYVGREQTAQGAAKGYQPATGHGIQTALKLLQASRRATTPIHLVIYELIPEEWQFHLEETKKAADAEVRRSNDLVARLNTVGMLNPAYQPSLFHQSDGLSVIDQLEGLGEQLQQASMLVLAEKECEYRAYRRSLRKEAPAAQGKPELKDCTIIEHYLEIATQLSAACTPRFFVSTNKNDYGDNNGSTLRAPLTAEFALVGLRWIQNFSALHELVK